MFFSDFAANIRRVCRAEAPTLSNFGRYFAFRSAPKRRAYPVYGTYDAICTVCRSKKSGKTLDKI